MIPIAILGGGPAGASAALAALGEGASVHVVEKSKFPRHKVCGEFLSPEIEIELRALRLWDAFLQLQPARVRRMSLHFGPRSRVNALPEPAWGLSRYAFDPLLLDAARERGAVISSTCEAPPGGPTVLARGRRPLAEPRGQRLFGFKAHFDGPANDAVELYFFRGGYVGMSPIEGGRTNVCGLARESVLRGLEFDFDRLLGGDATVAGRMKPLTRSMPWLSTGPLQFRQTLDPKVGEYPAGDALSFVDPFTGSGLLAAVKTGRLAGSAAARGETVQQHLKSCKQSLKLPFATAGMLRWLVDSGWAERLLPFAPGKLLFAATRPK